LDEHDGPGLRGYFDHTQRLLQIAQPSLPQQKRQ